MHNGPLNTGFTPYNSSSQALNDLFTKIMDRDVPARYLLRLGMGEQELESEQVGVAVRQGHPGLGEGLTTGPASQPALHFVLCSMPCVQDFSRVGRVNAMLARRLELLAQVRMIGTPYTGCWGLGMVVRSETCKIQGPPLTLPHFNSHTPAHSCVTGGAHGAAVWGG